MGREPWLWADGRRHLPNVRVGRLRGHFHLVTFVLLDVDSPLTFLPVRSLSSSASYPSSDTRDYFVRWPISEARLYLC